MRGKGTTGKCGGEGRGGQKGGREGRHGDTMWVSGALGCGKGRRVKRGPGERTDQAIGKDGHGASNTNNRK